MSQTTELHSISLTNIGQIPGAGGSPAVVSFSPDGRLVAIGEECGLITIRSSEKHFRILRRYNAGSKVRSIGWHPNIPFWFVAGCISGNLYAIHMRPNTEDVLLREIPGFIQSLSVNDDGTQMALGFSDGQSTSVALIDDPFAELQKPLQIAKAKNFPPIGKVPHQLFFLDKDSLLICYSGKSRFVIIQTKDPYAILWKMDAPVGYQIGCVALSPSRSEMAVTNPVSGIDFYSLIERKYLGSTYYDVLGKGKSNRMASIAYMREDFVVAGHADGKVIFVDTYPSASQAASKWVVRPAREYKLMRTDNVKIRSSLRLAYGVVGDEPTIFYADGEGENLYYVVLSVHFKHKNDVKVAKTMPTAAFTSSLRRDVPTTPLQVMVNDDPSRIALNRQLKPSHVAPSCRSHDVTSAPDQLPASAAQQVPPAASNQVVPTMMPNEVPPAMLLNQAPSAASSQVLPTEAPLVMPPGHINATSASDQEPITVSNNSSSASAHTSANSLDQLPLNVSDCASLNISDQVVRDAHIPLNVPASANATLPPTTASPSMSDLRAAQTPLGASDQAPSAASNQVSSGASNKEDSSPAARSGQLNSDNELPQVLMEKDTHHRQRFSIARKVLRALKAILFAVLAAWIVAIGYPSISSESLSNLKQALDRFPLLLAQPAAVPHGSETAQFLELTMALPTRPTVIAHNPEKTRLLELAAALASERYVSATGITQAAACTHVPPPTGSPAISIVVCTITETVTVTATQSVPITADLDRPTILPGPASPLKLTRPETVKSGSSAYYIFYCSILLFLSSFYFQILRLLPSINKLYHYMCHLFRYAHRLLHYMFCLFAQLTSPAEYNETYNETSTEKALESNKMVMESDLEAEKSDEELEMVNIKEDPDPKV